MNSKEKYKEEIFCGHNSTSIRETSTITKEKMEEMLTKCANAEPIKEMIKSNGIKKEGASIDLKVINGLKESTNVIILDNISFSPYYIEESLSSKVVMEFSGNRYIERIESIQQSYFIWDNKMEEVQAKIAMLKDCILSEKVKEDVESYL